jgi:phosphodiesterase/alkaline phosphatase D-like protein
MKRLALTSAFLAAIAVLGVTVASFIRWHFGGPVVATQPTHQFERFTPGPELESATDASAIVRWTGPNPGGTALHYGVVRYGTSASNLTEVAKSPNRRNPSNPDMTFRVRIMGLKPHTTYYYTVESVGATGVSDGRSGPVKTFQTM